MKAPTPAPNYPQFPCDCGAEEECQPRVEKCERCDGYGQLPYREILASWSSPAETWCRDCGCTEPEWIECGMCGGWLDTPPITPTTAPSAGEHL